jgi:hypothetical protein
MNERKFIEQLQQRAKEQEKMLKDMPMHKVFLSVSTALGNHPWRLLIPLSIILTLIFHLALGKPYDEFILNIFGKI